MNLFQTLSVSASGMSAQKLRAQLLVENIANAETTRTAEGGPYRRKDVVFESASVATPFSAVFQTAMEQDVVGVRASDEILDTREPLKRYQPGHPDADAQGYVAYPRMNPAEDMVDLMGASRGYQANATAMTALKEMINRSVDLLK